MKKLLYILIFTLPLSSIAQSDSVAIKEENPSFKNQFDLDVHIIGGELNYRRNISHRFSIGGAIYLGLDPIFVLEKKQDKQFYDSVHNITYGSGETFYHGNTYLEKFSFKILFDRKLSEKFHMHIAFKTILFHDEVLSSTNFFGLELGMFYQIRKIEIGIKPVIGNNQGQVLLGIPLFLIKVHLSKW